MKVLVTTEKPFAKIAIDDIRKEIKRAGFELTLLEKYTDKAQSLNAVKDANAIIIHNDIIDVEMLGAAKESKIVVRTGAGYDNVDLNTTTAHGVCVINTPGQSSNVVTELVFGLFAYTVHNFYNGTSGTELIGKKLGIHIYGNVGRNMARIAKGFGMELYTYDAFCPEGMIEENGMEAVDSAEELYKICSTVSLHIPATAETESSINRGLLKNTPKGAILVSTARKEVIDEDELIQLMEERPDFEYIADIIPTANVEFTELFTGRYFSTPKKMGIQIAEANVSAGIATVKQITGFLKEGREKFRVSK